MKSDAELAAPVALRALLVAVAEDEGARGLS